MHDFHYVDDELCCEGMPILKIAGEVGTPFYLYSYRTIKNHFKVFDGAFAGISHLVCFSAKSNANIAILKIFIREGSGVDIVSGGELYRALQAGVDPGKVVYSGVGKRADEIEYALKSGILMFNVESPQELEVINDCAGRLGKKAGISLRVNPDVDPRTHRHIATGLRENKFGISIERAREEYHRAEKLPHLDIKGISCHIGSQVTEIAPFTDTIERLKKIIRLLRKDGINIRYLDIGGGLGITYDRETPPHPSEYASAIMKASAGMDCTFIFEPGRVIVGNGGILVTRVLYTKATEDKNFVIVDAGMNDLLRPALYDSYHHIQPVVKREGQEIMADVVGPICESSDYLAKGRMIPRFERGELMAVMSAGAYGFSMSSNYNARPRIPEVLVRNDQFYVIRKREEYADLVRGEEIPNFLMNETVA
ncbi:MAG: diaminopimelate decarboxylase [Syntrophaceae bacterium CG2_30_49_12]|nr:MAG: diaminopimelate decarboxylase [Syntrophaceae bacterium CG2_30_49_12]PIP05761.1 MAG: diaminopimelate decarboxylase [Syntrophobacterales bacterium CG23_combo_of_CG06-09_8_20_14_all_48_27]PJC75790.1 MAG: diaminopimelate decarboxylase [Syntrophobacterales bacterium CG_4_8_14_3_um_filter_49_14]